MDLIHVDLAERRKMRRAAAANSAWTYSTVQVREIFKQNQGALMFYPISPLPGRHHFLWSTLHETPHMANLGVLPCWMTVTKERTPHSRHGFFYDGVHAEVYGITESTYRWHEVYPIHSKGFVYLPGRIYMYVVLGDRMVLVGDLDDINSQGQVFMMDIASRQYEAVLPLAHRRAILDTINGAFPRPRRKLFLWGVTFPAFSEPLNQIYVHVQETAAMLTAVWNNAVRDGRPMQPLPPPRRHRPSPHPGNPP